MSKSGKLGLHFALIFANPTVVLRHPLVQDVLGPAPASARHISHPVGAFRVASARATGEKDKG